MEEHETEPDVPCLVCYDLRLPRHPYSEPDGFERQRELARERSGYNPFDKHLGLFVEPKSLDATAAAGCLSCVFLKDVWGRLCHTEELRLGKGDMEGKHGFFLQSEGSRTEPSRSHVLFLCLKDHDYIIHHTIEGRVALYYHAGAQTRLGTNDKTNSRRIMPLGRNTLSTLEWLLTNVGSSAAVCERCI